MYNPRYSISFPRAILYKINRHLWRTNFFYFFFMYYQLILCTRTYWLCGGPHGKIYVPRSWRTERAHLRAIAAKGKIFSLWPYLAQSISILSYDHFIFVSSTFLQCFGFSEQKHFILRHAVQAAQFCEKYNLTNCLCFKAVSWQTQFHLLTLYSIHYNGFCFKKLYLNSYVYIALKHH